MRKEVDDECSEVFGLALKVILSCGGRGEGVMYI